MADLVRINDEIITANEFIKLLKLGGRYDELIEDIVREKLTVHSARKAGIEVSHDEVQERSDQIRRVRGLHRAVDMNRWLEKLSVSIEDLEDFIAEMLLHEKMQAGIATDAEVEAYFRLHAPEFDSVAISHIMVDSEDKAREIMAVAQEEPEMFSVLAREHSVADTALEGGYVGVIMRGNLPADIEAKVFHAEPKEVLGPFPARDGAHCEIFIVDDRRSGQLDEHTRGEIRRRLKEDWMIARAAENRVELC